VVLFWWLKVKVGSVLEEWTGGLFYLFLRQKWGVLTTCRVKIKIDLVLVLVGLIRVGGAVGSVLGSLPFVKKGGDRSRSFPPAQENDRGG